MTYAGGASPTIGMTGNEYTRLGYLTNADVGGNVAWGTNAHTTLGHLTAAQVRRALALSALFHTSDRIAGPRSTFALQNVLLLFLSIPPQTSTAVTAYGGDKIGMTLNQYTRLGYLTANDVGGDVTWGTNAHTTLGRLTAAQVRRALAISVVCTRLLSC